MGYIYMFVNRINNKKYVGQTINDNNTRYYQHMNAVKLEQNSEYNSPLHRAIRKYGIENFDYQILAKNIQNIDSIIQQTYRSKLCHTYLCQ